MHIIPVLLCAHILYNILILFLLSEVGYSLGDGNVNVKMKTRGERLKKMDWDLSEVRSGW